MADNMNKTSYNIFWLPTLPLCTQFLEEFKPFLRTRVTNHSLISYITSDVQGDLKLPVCVKVTAFSIQVMTKHCNNRFLICFLCQLTCQSADIMSSLCGVGVRVHVNNFSSKTTRPRDVLFFFKRYLIYRG